RRVECDQEDVESSSYHSHSFWSREVRAVAGHNGRSTPRWAISRNRSSQPARGRDVGRTTRCRSRTSSSSSPCRPVCSTITRGMRIPWEFPIRTSLVLIVAAMESHCNHRSCICPCAPLGSSWADLPEPTTRDPVYGRAYTRGHLGNAEVTRKPMKSEYDFSKGRRGPVILVPRGGPG